MHLDGIKLYADTDDFRTIGLVTSLDYDQEKLLQPSMDDLKDAPPFESLCHQKLVLKSHVSGQNKTSALNMVVIHSLACIRNIGKDQDQSEKNENEKWKAKSKVSYISRSNLLKRSKARAWLTLRHNVTGKPTRYVQARGESLVCYF